jgi:hypothetical protein
MLARGIAAWEGNPMIEDKGSGHNTTGMIDVYPATDGQMGIDACVSLALAGDMLAAMPAASSVYVCQPRQGGMVAVDVQVSASVAAKMLAAATRDGVSIRR